MTDPTAHEEPWHVRGVFAITLVTEDLPVTRDFYRAVFGVAPSFEDDHSAGFRVGSLFVNLLAASAAPELVEPAAVAPPESGSRFVLTVEVDDVDTVCAVLAERGVALLNGPMDRPWGPRTASFRDPAGHIWEIAS